MSKYVFLKDGVVTDRTQIDPHSVFHSHYASQFIEAPEEVDHFWTYDGTNWNPPPSPDLTDINKQFAQTLISSTDWAVQPDIADTNVTPHLLNQKDFIDFRAQLRAIYVNPPSTEVTWPTPPSEVWSS